MTFDRVRQVLDDFIREGIPGADCIITVGHEQVFRYYTGYADRESGRKTDGNELYLIFSMTKMITSVCAMQLYEQGRFGLDDPVSVYLPAFARMRLSSQTPDMKEGALVATGRSIGGGKEIRQDGTAVTPVTVRHLLTMTAGLDYDLFSPSIRAAIAEGKSSTQELADAIAGTVLGFEPGTRFRYSLCYDVLGALIEKWSGMTLGEYMHRRIFRPLGMEHTFFGFPEEKELADRMARLYHFDEEGKVKAVELANPFTLASGFESGGAGLTSTAADYSKFLEALACDGVSRSGYRLLLPRTIDLMSRNHLEGQALEDFHLLHRGYGYGFGVRTHMDGQESGSLSPVGEFGWDGAAGAFALVDRRNRLSLTYFQHVHETGYEFQRRLRNALYQDLNGMEAI